MEASESKKASKRKYDDKTTQFIFRLRNDKDAPIIARLRAESNKTAYLRSLVESDIRQHGCDDRSFL